MVKLGRRGTMGRYVSEAFTENIGLKSVALIMAVGLFYIVRGAEDASRTMFVEVVPTLPPTESGKVLVSEVPDRIRLTLRGSRSILQSVRRQDIEPVQIDLSDTTRRYYYVEPTIFEMPPGVTVEQIVPASIPLTWAERTERRVPVWANLVGEPGRGLVLNENVRIEPSRVLVEGPHTEVDRMSRVATAAIDIGNLPAGEYTRQVPIEPLPVHTVMQGASAVRVTFSIDAALSDRTLTGLVVTILGAPPRGLVRPTSVEVTVRGPRADVAGLGPDNLVPYVDPADLPPQQMSAVVPVRFRGVPDGVQVVRVEPAEVRLTVVRAFPPRREGEDG